MSSSTAFTGSVPRAYHTHLGPLIFDANARDIARRVSVGNGARVLEIACGTGIVTRELLSSMPAGAALTATDLNEAMLEVARSFVTDPRASFAAVDACALPYPDASFDAIVCQFGVMFFGDKPGAMRHARRVLKPGGRYVFNVWDALAHNPIPRVVHETLAELFLANPPMFLSNAPYGWSDRAEIERVVKAGGFARVAIETVDFESVAPTAEDAARGWVEGTPLWPALVERGVTDPAPIRGAVAKALGKAFGEAPCRSTMRAIAVTAE